MSSLPEPQAITPPPALGPPIIGTDPGSIPGIPQPVIVSGGQGLPPSFPLGSAGTWLPPPQVGFGANAPFSTPVVPAAPAPPSVAGFPQPQYSTGSGTVPTAASLFPMFTAAGASPPIVLNATQAAGANSPVWIAPPPLPLPTTLGIYAVVISTAPYIPQLPWVSQPPGLPVNTAPPTFTGNTIVGSTLTATTGTWTNSPTSYAYDWLSNGAQIYGANASTYVIDAAYLGTLISVRITAINANGEANADSAARGPVTATTGLSTATPHRQIHKPPPPPIRRR